MNMQVLRWIRFVGLSWSAILGPALLLFGLPGSRAQDSQQSDENKCYPWQYRDDNCDLSIYSPGGKRRKDERLKRLFSVRAFRRAIGVGSTRDFRAQSLAIGL